LIEITFTLYMFAVPGLMLALTNPWPWQFLWV